MNYGPILFFGLLLTMSLSWCGLILSPYLQLGSRSAAPPSDSSLLYPSRPPGLAAQGREIYRAEGCIECHTQQVRPNVAGVQLASGLVQAYLGPDLQRGWGQRYSVPQDYLWDSPVMAGHARIGPDLLNIGSRRPENPTNLLWHLRHLYDPRSMRPGSLMPAYAHLFERRPASPRTAALSTNGWREVSGTHEIVPKPAAIALAAYLFNRRAEAPLFEAPLPSPAQPAASTNALGTGTGTNAPSSATNAQPQVPQPPSPASPSAPPGNAAPPQ